MVTRISAILAITLASLLLGNSESQAQNFRYHQRGFETHGRHFHQPSVPDAAVLDDYADRLEGIAKHLHEDAHSLSQDYEHSESVESTVSQLEDLQSHLHKILHRASTRGRLSAKKIRHVKKDVREVAALLRHLDRELRHQSFDGTRNADFRTIAHMRRIIRRQAFPLVRLMEEELYGHARSCVQTLDRHSHLDASTSSRNRVALPPVYQPPKTSSVQIRLPRFRFSF